MMKAFLSHSSHDKEFVRSVANNLGRQFCVFDEKSFRNGDEFRDAIRKGFDDSSVLVFFASRNALDSLWVNFELNEAELRLIYKHLKKAIVFLLDSQVDHSDLPSWMQRSLAKRMISPKQVSRDIRFHIDEIFRQKQQPFFVGRENDLQRANELLSPYDGSLPPKVIFVNGLKGIGKRMFIKRAAKDYLNITKSIEIPIQSGDDIYDICIKIAEKLEPFSSEDRLRRVVDQIRNQKPEEVINRIFKNINVALSGGECLIIIDEGGLLKENGYVEDFINTIIERTKTENDAYLFFSSQRRPYFSEFEEDEFPQIKLNPMKEKYVKQLITMISNRFGPSINKIQTVELSEYIGGFPPAVYYAMNLARNYGIEVVLSDKSRLIEFQATSFIRYLRDLSLNENEKLVLMLLDTFSPLPLRVIGNALNISRDELSTTLIRLIDSSLIIPDEYSLYWLASPIKSAVSRVLGLLPEKYYSLVLGHLKNFLLDPDFDEPVLNLYRVLYRATVLTGDTPDSRTTQLSLVNDMIKLIEDLYHRQEYKRAIDIAEHAIRARPDNMSILWYLIRALIQEEKWDNTKHYLEIIRDKGNLKDYYFLIGFMCRRQQKHDDAITAYNESLSQNMKGVAIHRELALCYFHSNNYDKAKYHIDKAQEIDLDNRFVVDLQVSIASKSGNEHEARKRLELLEKIEETQFYLHRLSTVEYNFNRFEDAYDAAKRAYESTEKPRFEMMAQLIKCEIQQNFLDDAKKHIDEMTNRFRSKLSDVQHALRCKYEIAGNNYTNALREWKNISDKEMNHAKVLRREILKGFLDANVLSDEDRTLYENEIEQLSNYLNSSDRTSMDIFL
jgi:tetratricopeptide (TPR) repeat protein